jgi:pimeloyl-ACP methyl ester carboxylesterase
MRERIDTNGDEERDLPLGVQRKYEVEGTAIRERGSRVSGGRKLIMEQIISKDGTPIGFRRCGTGPPLIFVHGTTADHRSWAKASPSLEQHFTVYAMDRRGRGASGDGPNYEFTREVEDVVALVEATNEPAYLFGHSFGGLLSLEAALLTDNVRWLILYEPVLFPGNTIPPGALEQIQALVDGKDLETAMEVFLREIAQMTEPELEAYRQSPLWKPRIPLVRTITRETAIERSYRFEAKRFASLRTPTMLLLGGESPQFTREAIQKLDAALPDSKIAVLPGEGHVAHHSNPELLVREVLKLLVE